MRVLSGDITKKKYFIAVDETDKVSRETGFSSFTVYRSRNGAAAAVMTTPTIAEVDATNMPGVYTLLMDEDMTIGSGNDEEEMVFHITHAGMLAVSTAIQLVRPKMTAGNTLAVSAAGLGSADMKAIDGSLTAASNLKESADNMIVFTVTGTPTTTEVAASALTGVVGGDNRIVGKNVYFLDGSAKYEPARIISYIESSGTMGITTLSVAPTAGDKGIIM